MDREHEQFFAAYEAWEATSDACYANILGAMNGKPLDPEQATGDRAELQRLHADWLKKSEAFLDESCV